MQEAIAERRLVFVEASGEPLLVFIRIGKPSMTSAGDWACPVSLYPLEAKLADIHGVDSFQALMLAQRFLASLMTGRVEKGGSFLDLETRTPIDVSRLFAGG